MTQKFSVILLQNIVFSQQCRICTSKIQKSYLSGLWTVELLFLYKFEMAYCFVFLAQVIRKRQSRNQHSPNSNNWESSPTLGPNLRDFGSVCTGLWPRNLPWAPWGIFQGIGQWATHFTKTQYTLYSIQCNTATKILSTQVKD